MNEDGRCGYSTFLKINGIVNNNKTTMTEINSHDKQNVDNNKYIS